MNPHQFQKLMQQEKKERFELAVARTAVYLKVPIPKVNFHSCPHKLGNEMAHFHPDTNEICIEEEMIEMLTLDQIEETAVHEVTHALHQSHGSGFQETHIDCQINSWSSEQNRIVEG